MILAMWAKVVGTVFGPGIAYFDLYSCMCCICGILHYLAFLFYASAFFFLLDSSYFCRKNFGQVRGLFQNAERQQQKCADEKNNCTSLKKIHMQNKRTLQKQQMQNIHTTIKACKTMQHQNAKKKKKQCRHILLEMYFLCPSLSYKYIYRHIHCTITCVYV